MAPSLSSLCINEAVEDSLTFGTDVDIYVLCVLTGSVDLIMNTATFFTTSKYTRIFRSAEGLFDGELMSGDW